MSAQQMRDLEQTAIESGAVTGLELMERAGEGVIEAIVETWPALSRAQKALVLCGPGNNGGDGFVVARLLQDRGWDVSVLHYGGVQKLPADAKTNHDRWRAASATPVVEMSFPITTAHDEECFERMAYGAPAPALLVDALFGIGLSRPLSGLKSILECTATRSRDAFPPNRPCHVSIDVPSGLSETGSHLSGTEPVFMADLTVTFHSLKKAHAACGDWCGQVLVKEIGL